MFRLPPNQSAVLASCIELEPVGGRQPASWDALSVLSSRVSSPSALNALQVPSEDGMGSVLGTLAGTEDSANEDLQWKRSALKKFHKVDIS